ncbi:unnamed protein product, partial [marine sediment metagenome]
MFKDNSVNMEMSVDINKINENINSDKKEALETQELTKRFGGLIAVNNFDLKVNQGEISSLIGPNGAGKTTV